MKKQSVKLDEVETIVSILKKRTFYWRAVKSIEGSTCSKTRMLHKTLFDLYSNPPVQKEDQQDTT
jgi:hypothetical protein